jgi:hypothetical protein
MSVWGAGGNNKSFVGCPQAPCHHPHPRHPGHCADSGHHPCPRTAGSGGGGGAARTRLRYLRTIHRDRGCADPRDAQPEAAAAMDEWWCGRAMERLGECSTRTCFELGSSLMHVCVPNMCANLLFSERIPCGYRLDFCGGRGKGRYWRAYVFCAVLVHALTLVCSFGAPSPHSVAGSS